MAESVLLVKLVGMLRQRNYISSKLFQYSSIMIPEYYNSIFVQCNWPEQLATVQSTNFSNKQRNDKFLMLNTSASNAQSYGELFSVIKDGAYYCYCAYVLCISRYSDFLSLMLTNTGIFLRGLKLSEESRS